MSTIFYKFPHQSTENRLTFDGTHISVFDVKKEVMLQTKMGSGRDFDLSVTDASSKEVLVDDHHQIPRSTSVIIRRIAPNPKLKNGGTAARYIAGTSATVGGRDDLVDRRVEQSSRAELMNKRGMGGIGRGGGGGGGGMGTGHMTVRFDKKDDGDEASSVPAPPATEEEARLAAFFNETSNQWEQTHEALSHQTRVAGSGRGSFRPRGGGPGHLAGGPPANFSGQAPPPGMSSSNWHYMMNPDKEPPPGYICFRCGQKGHWIQACPTNENPDFEGKPRFKRTTGIPKSFLKTVEKPADGADADDLGGNGASVMITGDGSFVTVQPDHQTWRKTTKPKLMTAGELLNLTSDGSGGGLALPPHLVCPVCTRLLHTPSRTPCCKSLYCEECIHNHLLDNDFVCPSCESKIPSLNRVKADEEVKKQVDEFVDVEVERRKQERKDASGENEGSDDETKPVVKADKDEVTTEETKAKPEEAGAKPDVTSDPTADSTAVTKEATDPEPVAVESNPQMMNEQLNQQQQQQQYGGGGGMDPNMMLNMMNMMGMMGGMGGMMGGMNPMMAMQAQAAQIMMNLQTPGLLHPVRLQLQMQLNMLQAQMSQMGMMGMPMGGGGGGGGMMMGSPMMGQAMGQPQYQPQQQQQQQQQFPGQAPPRQMAMPQQQKRKMEEGQPQGGPATKQARQ